MEVRLYIKKINKHSRKMALRKVEHCKFVKKELKQNKKYEYVRKPSG